MRKLRKELTIGYLNSLINVNGNVVIIETVNNINVLVTT